MTSFKLNKIKRFELIKPGKDKFSQSSNMFLQMKYGMIVLGISGRNKIAFGQSQTMKELELLIEELTKKITLPTPK